ncbi:MAG: AAA family ATPase [Saprospiraceae bacterium]
MAKADLLKALIHSHFEEDRERFNLLALQIAAQEARLGHTVVAGDIKTLIDKNRSRIRKDVVLLPGFDDLISKVEIRHKLSELVSSPKLKNQLGRVLLEYRQRDTLQKHGLFFRRKILLTGPPGTGKTMSASVIATELHLPLYIVTMDRVVQKYMGETNAKLRQVFDIIREQPGVYFFDEFDAIGGDRSKDNDVGEMRRVVNAFLQFLENDASDSFILAATNNLRLLDQALFRRFDDVLMYHLPSEEEARRLLTNTVGTFLGNQMINGLPQGIERLSQAELVQIGCDTIKDAILAGEKKVDLNILANHLQEKIAFQTHLKP